MRKFRYGSDDGYDRFRDDRDGYVTEQERLDRQAEEVRRLQEESDRKWEESRKNPS